MHAGNPRFDPNNIWFPKHYWEWTLGTPWKYPLSTRRRRNRKRKKRGREKEGWRKNKRKEKRRRREGGRKEEREEDREEKEKPPPKLSIKINITGRNSVDRINSRQKLRTSQGWTEIVTQVAMHRN